MLLCICLYINLFETKIFSHKIYIGTLLQCYLVCDPKMAKVDASVVKAAYDRVARAKAAMYEARKALELTAEFRSTRDAEKELELSEDCLAGVQTLLNPKVV